jgi:hypothetical protein
MRKVLAVAFLMLTSSPAYCWNEHGHYVVCRLAWLQMTEQQRTAVTAILKKHPHYDAYLTKQKPDGFTVDEWAFMRAGAWADWSVLARPAPTGTANGITSATRSASRAWGSQKKSTSLRQASTTRSGR